MTQHEIFIGLGIIFLGFGPLMAGAIYIYFNMDKVFLVPEDQVRK